MLPSWRSGSTPWLYRFIAMVTISILPVRSPLPIRVPSTRSAPARTPSSAAATAQPRSLWVCREISRLSRLLTWSQNHSIWSAYTLGVLISTVAGRLMITGFSGVGCHTAVTASQTSTANSSSVPVKLSGEYSNTHSVSGYLAAQSCNNFAPCTAISMMPCRSSPNTCSRCTVEVELYM